MIFQSQSGYIFGGYSPCQWQMNKSYVQDDTLSSFLFSQTHNQIYPLKSDRKQYAINCDNSSGYGPAFGGGMDLRINTDFKDGYSTFGHTYQWEKQESNSSHLYGQQKPNISECEIFELKFM